MSRATRNIVVYLSIEQRLGPLVGEHAARDMLARALLELRLPPSFCDLPGGIRLADWLIRQSGFPAILGHSLKVEYLSSLRQLADAMPPTHRPRTPRGD